jgi:hypothetical protein
MMPREMISRSTTVAGIAGLPYSILSSMAGMLLKLIWRWHKEKSGIALAVSFARSIVQLTRSGEIGFAGAYNLPHEQRRHGGEDRS